jgi:chemotaxis protein methyltransferase CheR
LVSVEGKKPLRGRRMSDFVFFQGVAKERTPQRSGQRIRRHLRSAVTTAAAEEAAAFFDVLFELGGLRRDSYRLGYLERRLPACLRLLGAKSAENGISRLRAQPQLALNVMNAVLLGVTEFYRDQSVFQQVRDALIPAWSLRRQARRIWSAGCSDGHELYTMAIMLAEAGMLEDAELLGTDCRGQALARAAEGRFRTEALGGVPQEWKARWFAAEGESLVIDARLRGQLRWRQADLLSGAERGPWHLVLWRNVAIYLEMDAAREIWQALAAEIAPGGCLITGKADYPPRGIGLVRIAPCIYQRVSHAPHA